MITLITRGVRYQRSPSQNRATTVTINPELFGSLFGDDDGVGLPIAMTIHAKFRTAFLSPIESRQILNGAFDEDQRLAHIARIVTKSTTSVIPSREETGATCSPSIIAIFTTSRAKFNEAN